MTDASDLARLRWRCRRGTRELDALLSRFLDLRYAAADAARQQAFAELLEQQDPDLWDWLVGKQAPPRADWQGIIDEIRACDRV